MQGTHEKQEEKQEEGKSEAYLLTLLTLLTDVESADLHSGSV